MQNKPIERPSQGQGVRFIPQGAIIQEFSVAGQNIVLNFPSSSAYATHNAAYFGETIGRVANRVAGGTVGNLNGQTYQLATNDGENSLHGGSQGWGKRVFTGPILELNNGTESAKFRYTSPHGDEGYPGTLEVLVTYTGRPIDDHDGDGFALEIEYEVKFADKAENVYDESRETVVNVTNHSYFNLSNSSNIEGTLATLTTDQYLPRDNNGIPKTGVTTHPTVTKGEAFTLDAAEPVFDDCFVLNSDLESISLDSRSSPLRTAAKFYHPSTKIHLEVQTTEPAFQFYTGDYVDTPTIETAPQRGPRSGFCVEPCRYVNAVNVEDWRHMVLLRRGEIYGSRIVYRAWKG
ncbi:MAG: hypothetical protein M1833_004228 [Piccolia ochrophora]|nr:MAG: hypothetical protein M1833_004228 [Piccolia ochrophora]